jgi:uncharacterized membrane protein HdeD (DUF308 family)
MFFYNLRGGFLMPEAGEKSIIQKLAQDIWWLVLIRGIIVTILGLLLVFRTAETVTALVWLMGIYWFIDGIFTVVESIRGRKSHQNWGWGVFVGILSLLAGIVVFTRPFITAVMGAMFVIYLIAFMIMSSGIGSIFTGIRLRKKIDNEWSMILSGALYTLFGLMLLINPMVSAMVLTNTVGFFALAGGIVLIILAMRLHKVTKVVFASGDKLGE